MIKYNCDTKGGASGGPVFDKDGFVIGLHNHSKPWEDVCIKPNYLNGGLNASRLWDVLGRGQPCAVVRQHITGGKSVVLRDRTGYDDAPVSDGNPRPYWMDDNISSFAVAPGCKL